MNRAILTADSRACDSLRLSGRPDLQHGFNHPCPIHIQSKQDPMADGIEERKEREQRLAQQKQEDPKDRINHDEPDEWEPERPIS